MERPTSFILSSRGGSKARRGDPDITPAAPHYATAGLPQSLRSLAMTNVKYHSNALPEYQMTKSKTPLRGLILVMNKEKTTLHNPLASSHLKQTYLSFRKKIARFARFGLIIIGNETIHRSTTRASSRGLMSIDAGLTAGKISQNLYSMRTMKRTTVTTLVANLRRAIARCLDRTSGKATRTDSRTCGTSRIDDGTTTGALCPNVTGGWSLGVLLIGSLFASTSLPAAEQDNWYLAHEWDRIGG